MASAYTAEKTWASGDVFTASDVNLYLRDNMQWVATDKPVCRVINSANISVTSGGNPALTFDTERFDNQNMHSTVTNTSRLSVPSGMSGKFLLIGNIEWAGNATGTRTLQIRVTGTTTVAFEKHPTDSTNTVQMLCQTLYDGVGGTDYFELLANQNSGGNLNVNAQTYSPVFTAIWLST